MEMRCSVLKGQPWPNTHRPLRWRWRWGAIRVQAHTPVAALVEEDLASWAGRVVFAVGNVLLLPAAVFAKAWAELP